MVVSRPLPAGARELLDEVQEYLPEDRVGLVERALDFAITAHGDQKRRSGDPYITHPIAVARLVTSLRMDPPTIAAALLHDTIEDCDVKPETIGSKFGADVQQLVEGATKIDQLPDSALDIAQADAETLRKMFLAMAEDVRVVIVKMADRLHNMRTLEWLSPERQRALARETMDIYAPLASRLGVWQFKWELEDLAFRYLQPQDYRRVAAMVAQKRSERERYVKQLVDELESALAADGIQAEVAGRAKHLYSVYQKMQRYQAGGRTFSEIHDLLAVRVLVPTVQDCYNALGIVHQKWRPLPGSFDDYIASPKESLYQSLHTSVLGPGMRTFEVQIRTFEMHQVSEYGVAAHWQYKEERSKRDQQYEERMSWLRHLLEWQQEASGTDDFLESIKTDVFRDQVFIYTPKGEVRVLPAGSTPVDFAYRVHTDLGHNTVGAKVNDRMVPLNTVLRNGDVVEIMRSRTPRGPSRDWLINSLGYLGSSHSRQKVRQWFRRSRREENVEKGREHLERELKRLGLREMPAEFPKSQGFADVRDLYAALGSGDYSSQRLSNRLVELVPDHEVSHEPHTPSQTPAQPSRPGGTEGGKGIRVLGQTGLQVQVARCCRPLPGDAIVGYITRARGVTVHRGDCRNVHRGNADRVVDCDWGPAGDIYTASVEIIAWDRVGLLRDVSTIIASYQVNMIGVRTIEQADRTTIVQVTVETEGGSQFARLLTHLDSVRGVISVRRTGGNG
ncbi:MAG: bifunctional (p)ppGpp synthetase/guanosine-3',5'-bis(diphosphate) 3'-pyrophosphohydrolase [Chloroflexi bacterium]|nr:bifunctional (p)ppGpp synthetase/guanosine-3',5'-bis(diphosphate) 3'-pyrophosphohydrolase [Chloroflexota bacterium]